MLRALLVVFAALVVSGCGHVAKLHPTAANAVAFDATFGGPIGRVEGYTIPLPLVSAGFSYGLMNGWDVDAHLHVTTALFGDPGADVGTTFEFLQGEGGVPSIVATARGYAFTDLQSTVLFAELSPTISWRIGGILNPYLSASAFAQHFDRLPAFSIAGGLGFQFGGSLLQLEARWYQPGYSTVNLPTEWQGISGYGAVGALIAFQQTFGGKR